MSLPTATTQNDVITALVDALLLLPALAEVTVTSAPLDFSKYSLDQVSVLDIPDGSESWYGIGNMRRSESYSIAMHCLAIRSGADEAEMREARNAAYAMHNAVADYVRTNPRLGGVTIKQMSGTNLTQGYEALQRWSRLTWTIRIDAQIEVA